MKQVKIVARTKRASTSVKKVLPVADRVKQLSPAEALTRLEFSNRRAAKILAKVIKQAIANASNNYELAADQLQFASIEVNKGPMMKRFRPVSRGRAHQILRRTANIKVVLEPRHGTES